jgi:hypothetical protein
MCPDQIPEDSKPYSLLSPIKKKIYADNFHIVFKENDNTHFIAFQNTSSGKLAFNVEKVS